MNGWQVLLFPFAIIYDIVTRCRNWLYDVGLFAAHSFPTLRIISVGNLSVGGTGKTPMVEYLIRKGLESNAHMAVLSRGYGRKTKGVRIAKHGDRAAELGDESFGYFEQFGNKIQVVVAEKRVQGIAAIQANFPDVQVVILDDAFQHRAVKPDLSILLTNYARPFWLDYVLPAGRLREARSGAKRADVVVLTKCPEIQEVEIDKKMSYLQNKAEAAAATSVKYGALVQMHGEPTNKVIAVAGLADNQPFFDLVKHQFDLVETYSFPDHKAYGEADLSIIIQKAQDHGCILLVTTFKDAVKWKDIGQMENVAWGYVPIETVFVRGEDEFLKKITPFLNPPSESVQQP